MPLTASPGQQLRINSKSQDFEIMVLAGPKRDRVQVSSSPGLTPTFPAAVILSEDFDITAGAKITGSITDYPDSGYVWIADQMYSYNGKLDSPGNGFADMALVHGRSGVPNVAGTAVVAWYDVSDIVTGVSISEQLDGHVATCSASLSGINFNSGVLNADVAIAIQARFYPDYPGLRIGGSAGGSWNGVVVNPSTVGWSSWTDIFFGYIVQGSVSVDSQSNTWQFSVEGTNQYLRNSEAPAKTFGRRNIAQGKSTQTSSVLQNLVWERRGTAGGENEYVGSPDVSGAATVDDDMSTLWVSDGFPTVTSVGQVEGVTSGHRPYPIIDGYCTRSPWPQVADKYAQWISTYHPGDTDNKFSYSRYEGNWSQAIVFARYRPELNDSTRQEANDYEILDIHALANNLTIGKSKRVVFCYSKWYFNLMFGQHPDVTVVEWGIKFPNWVLNPNRDILLEIDPGGKSGDGNYCWPLGWSNGNTHPSDPEWVEGVFWGYPEGRPVPDFKGHNAWSTHYLAPRFEMPPLQTGWYAQRAKSGDGNAGFITTQRSIVGQGTKHHSEWLTIDLGELYTQVNIAYSYATSGNTITVDSTEGFASTGLISIERNSYSYTSKSETKFFGLILLSGDGSLTHTSGTFVHQITDSGQIIDMPLISAIQYKRPFGKSIPTRGEVRVSDRHEAPNPLASLEGEDWTDFWNAGVWRFNDIPGYLTPNMATFEVIVTPPRRARHVCFYIEGMSNDNRAKLNEIAVYESGVTAGEGDALVGGPESSTGAIIYYYLHDKFGLSIRDLFISEGIPFVSMGIATGDYWSTISQLAVKTDHLLHNDRYNRIRYTPHPLWGMLPSEPPVFFEWTDDTMESVSLQILQPNRVGQIILRARDPLLKQGYYYEYPSTPMAVGTKKAIDDTLIFGQANLAQKAQKHFKYENRTRSVSWKTFIADEISVGQRHRITATIDDAGVELNGADFFVTQVQFDISVDASNKSWSTSVTAEEYLYS